MKLRDLLKDIGTGGMTETAVPDVDIASVENDSRRAGAGSLFVAYSSYVDDAHRFVSDAYAAGCRHFVVGAGRLEDFRAACPGAFVFPAPDLPAALSEISRRFYGDPSRKLTVVGITGTSGKTTTAFLVYQALRMMGRPAGLIGTIDIRVNDQILPSTNTTPDILALTRTLDTMVLNGVQVLVMEVSSHSLALGRVENIHFDVAAFTNFSQDHLDFHGTMDDYLLAKLRIFTLLDRSGKDRRVAIVNCDSARFEEIILAARSCPRVEVKTVSLRNANADYGVSVRDMSPSHADFVMNGRDYHIDMMGLTNVYNFAMGSAVLIELGFKPEEFGLHLRDIRVKGRMEYVRNPEGVSVIVDYAHKPDALDKLLRTVRDVRPGHGTVITVFGAGGDRDRAKRPLMGRIAGELSDMVIVTSDNPRTEDPLRIIREIEAGVRESGNKRCLVEADRAAAIRMALARAKKGDIVVIAGKGHEDYQIVGRTKNHFSDREQVEEYYAGGKRS